MISNIKRKSLPEIARAVGLHDAQPLQIFLTESPWQVREYKRAAIRPDNEDVTRIAVQARYK